MPTDGVAPGGRALNRKHHPVPHSGGSHHHNYNDESFHLVLLMARVDSDYTFMSCDVGAAGRGCLVCGRTAAAAALVEGLEGNIANLLPPEPLPGFDQLCCLIGDDTFPAREWTLEPFP